MAFDYGSEFANFQVSPDLAPAPTAGGGFMGGLEKLFANPTMQMLMLNAGGAMAPKDWAGNMATAVRPMMQSRALVDAFKGMQTQNVPAAVAQVDPMVKAKELSTASSILKKAAEISPTVVPGFGDMLKKAANSESMGSAFATKPELAPNPTQPIGDEIAGQAPVGALPNVQPFSFNLSPDIAGAMTPEQVMGLYAYGSAQKKQELEIQKQINDNLIAPLMRGETVARTSYLAGHGNLANVEARMKEWEQTPEGQAWQIKKIIAPVQAQAEVEEKKRTFAMDAIGKILGSAASQTLPGFPMTIGQMASLSAASPHSGDMIANTFNAIARVREAASNHAAVRERIAADKQMLEEDKAMKNLATLDARLNDLIKRPAERDFPNTPEGKSALQMARMNGQVRTKEQDDAIVDIQRQRQAMTAKIPGLVYSPIPVSGVAKSNAVAADPAKLEAIKKGLGTDKKKVEGSPLDIIKLFTPSNTEYRGI